MKETSSVEFSKLLSVGRDAVQIVDVREPNEFAEVRIAGSVNVPLSSLSPDSPEIDWSKNVVFVCRSWARSGRVTAAFEDIGKDATNLAWGVAGLAQSHPELLEYSC